MLLRQMIGEALRNERVRQRMTLRELSATARVSLGYISEIERGRKEASSELLASLCEALGLPLSSLLRTVSTAAAGEEMAVVPAPLRPVPATGLDAEPATGEVVASAA